MSRPAPGDEPDVLWVTSDVAADGSYIVAVSLNEDATWPVDKPMEYAMTVVAVAELAEYDAAIFAQLTDRGTPFEDVAQLVMSLREGRPGPDPTLTAPLSFAPGVAMRTRRAFITVSVNGEPRWQWDVAAAHQHALQIMSAATVARLDEQYHRVLCDRVKLADDTARTTVANLDKYRAGVR